MQFFGAFLIVLSLAIAKAPDVLAYFDSEDDITKIVVKVATSTAVKNKTMVAEKEDAVAAAAATTSTVNAVPLSAVLLALLSASISGTALYSKLFLSTHRCQHTGFLKLSHLQCNNTGKHEV